MDRETDNVCKSQVGFIQFVVEPMYEAYMAFAGEEVMSALMTHLQENAELWRQEADNGVVFTATRDDISKSTGGSLQEGRNNTSFARVSFTEVGTFGGLQTRADHHASPDNDTIVEEE